MFIFCFQICLRLMNHGQTEKRRVEDFWVFFMGYGRAGDTPLLLSYWIFFCLCWVFMISQKHYVMGISGRGYMACSHLIHLHTPIFFQLCWNLSETGGKFPGSLGKASPPMVLLFMHFVAFHRHSNCNVEARSKNVEHSASFLAPTHCACHSGFFCGRLDTPLIFLFVSFH